MCRYDSFALRLTPEATSMIGNFTKNAGKERSSTWTSKCYIERPTKKWLPRRSILNWTLQQLIHFFPVSKICIWPYPAFATWSRPKYMPIRTTCKYRLSAVNQKTRNHSLSRRIFRVEYKGCKVNYPFYLNLDQLDSFEPRPTDVCVAAFPKTGMVLTRHLCPKTSFGLSSISGELYLQLVQGEP